MAGVTAALNFYFYLILIDFDLKSHLHLTPPSHPATGSPPATPSPKWLSCESGDGSPCQMGVALPNTGLNTGFLKQASQLC